jgi:hypothetical protein
MGGLRMRSADCASNAAADDSARSPRSAPRHLGRQVAAGLGNSKRYLDSGVGFLRDQFDRQRIQSRVDCVMSASEKRIERGTESLAGALTGKSRHSTPPRRSVRMAAFRRYTMDRARPLADTRDGPLRSRASQTDFDSALQTQRSDSVLAGGKEPAGSKPQGQGRTGAVQDRSGGDGTAHTARGALESPVAQSQAVTPQASRTNEPGGPAQPLQVIQAVGIGSKPSLELPRASLGRACLLEAGPAGESIAKSGSMESPGSAHAGPIDFVLPLSCGRQSSGFDRHRLSTGTPRRNCLPDQWPPPPACCRRPTAPLGSRSSHPAPYCSPSHRPAGSRCRRCG